MDHKKMSGRVLALLLCVAMLLGLAACGGDGQTESTTAGTTTQVPEDTTAVPETTDSLQNQEDENGFKTIKLNVTTSADQGDPLPFRELSADEIVAEMGTGWNLGNTMDGHSGLTPNETLWQDVETTQGLIDAVHDLGFNTVRIPITWGTMINDDYSINEKWISRVQDIVDYCVRQDMYVIINVHHDGADQAGWLNIATDDLDALYEMYAGVWNTIATYFRDYDEHLIFESMNEVYGGDDINYDTAVIMNLNQIFVNVVRSSGSNNEHRWLSVPGRYTNVEHMTNSKYGFELPEDTVEGRIFASVHYYDWSFGMMENMVNVEFTEAKVKELAAAFDKLVERFTSQGIPVIMGEYGAINKNNSAQRAYHNEVFNLLAKNAGVVPVYWDQGWYDRTQEPADYSFTLVDRNTYQTIDKDVTDALMRGFFVDSGDVSSITVSPAVTSISGITLGQTSVELTIGDVYYADVTVAPENTNDVLLWKTADPGVATVYNGIIRARGIGTTTITAFSQSGSVAQTLTVTVGSVGGDTSNANLTTASKSYTVTEGKWINLGASLTGVEDSVYLTYASQDPNIATVNQFGKVVGIAPGTCDIYVRGSNGMWTTVTVTVEEQTFDQVLRLALNVLYNDDTLGYYSNETGPVIEIYQDGQYTVTFDCAADLSQTALDVGITGLNNLTAIYIKDYDVTIGELKKSIVNSCQIRWDSIVVDGVELTITNSDFKSALKVSGIFDTNDPLNSWDGSAVEEVTTSNHVLNINMENPQTITVTFTIMDLKFAE